MENTFSKIQSPEMKNDFIMHNENKVSLYKILDKLETFSENVKTSVLQISCYTDSSVPATGLSRCASLH